MDATTFAVVVTPNVIAGYNATATLTCNGVASAVMQLNQTACTGNMTAAKTTAVTLDAQTYYDSNTAPSLVAKSVAAPSVKALFNNWACA